MKKFRKLNRSINSSRVFVEACIQLKELQVDAGEALLLSLQCQEAGMPVV